MTDPSDRLEQQLRAAVRARARAQRPWRARRGGLALALAGTLVVSGGAVAATRLASDGRSPRAEGRSLARQAVVETSASAACSPRRIERSFSDAVPLPEALAVLPLLAAPGADEAALPRTPPRQVLRSTVHSRRVGGHDIVVYVEDGVGFDAKRDPAGCRVERLTRAEQLLQGRSANVRRWTLRRLDELRDSVPGLQTLWILTGSDGAASTGGTGVPVTPGTRLPTGLLGHTSNGRGGEAYTGLARAGTSAVRVTPKHGPRQTVRVVDRLWVVDVPSGAGPTRLAELDDGGRVVQTTRLR